MSSRPYKRSVSKLLHPPPSTATAPPILAPASHEAPASPADGTRLPEPDAEPQMVSALPTLLWFVVPIVALILWQIFLAE